MRQSIETLNGVLGRIIFRAVGIGCVVVALICGYAGWWLADNRNPGESLVPVILFALAALAAGSVVPYCFSRKRSFVDALDAMEEGSGDMHPRKTRP